MGGNRRRIIKGGKMGYKLTAEGVLLGNKSIPNDPKNKDWIEFKKWEAEGNIPLPADPTPIPEDPEPTVSELIDALEAKDTGDNTKWDIIKSRKKVKNA